MALLQQKLNLEMKVIPKYKQEISNQKAQLGKLSLIVEQHE